MGHQAHGASKEPHTIPKERSRVVNNEWGPTLEELIMSTCKVQLDEERLQVG